MTEATQTPDPTAAVSDPAAPAETTPAPDAADATGQPVAAEPPVRPDYIPEAFWDAEAGFKTDDFNALLAFKAEFDANRAQVPAKPEDYKVALPREFQLPEGLVVPEGESLIDENDPRIAAARDYAHERGMSQSDFEEMVALGVRMDLNERDRLQEAVAAQKQLLGTNADARIGAVKTWIAAKLGGELGESLTAMMFTARQIQAFEALMRLNRGAVPGNPGVGRDGNGAPGQIDGYENMTFRQRMAAIDAYETGNR